MNRQEKGNRHGKRSPDKVLQGGVISPRQEAMAIPMNTTTQEEKIPVCVSIPPSELAEMRRVTCVDASGPAVLALARKGLAAELAKEPQQKDA